MQNIVLTNLGNKVSNVVKSLKNGESVNVVHNSKVIGEIKPKKEPKVFTRESIEDLKRLVKEMNLPKTTYAEREKRYRTHLMKKYGKGLS